MATGFLKRGMTYLGLTDDEYATTTCGPSPRNIWTRSSTPTTWMTRAGSCRPSRCGW